MVALKLFVQIANLAALVTVFALLISGLLSKRRGWLQRYRLPCAFALFGLALTSGLLSCMSVWPLIGVRNVITMLLAALLGRLILRWPVEQPKQQSIAIKDSDEAQLKKDLAGALERGELQVHYQPQFEASSEHIRGFEALLRWIHPKLGPIPPDKFIPIAEDMGWIVPIGEWVLRQACQTHRQLREDQTFSTIMSVNISAVQLQQASFADRVGHILKESGLPPDSLELEITESTLILSWEAAAQTLSRLHRRGVRIALDDFGKGYSSLSYLQKLPVHLVKIDRSFIQGMTHSLRDKRLVESVIHLVHELGIGVLAEGIEKEEQLHCLKKLSCDCVQGYLLGRPMEPRALSFFLEAYRERQLYMNKYALKKP